MTGACPREPLGEVVFGNATGRNEPLLDGVYSWQRQARWCDHGLQGGGGVTPINANENRSAASVLASWPEAMPPLGVDG